MKTAKSYTSEVPSHGSWDRYFTRFESAHQSTITSIQGTIFMTHSCLRQSVRILSVPLLLGLWLAGCQKKYSISGSHDSNGGGAAGAANGGEAGDGGAALGSGSGGEGGTSKATTGGKSSKGGAAGNGGTVAAGGATTSVAAGATAAGGTTAVATTAAALPVCGLTPNPTDERTKRRLLVRDEGSSVFGLVDVGNAANSWFVTLDREDGATEAQGRDIQLVGNCRVLLGTDIGYDEYDLTTRTRVAEVTTFPGTLAAYRLASGNTLLVGVGTSAAPWQGQVGIVVLQVNAAGATVGAPIVYSGGTYARLVRPTAQGTYLIGNNLQIIEVNSTGTLLAPTFKVPTDITVSPHAWMGIRSVTAASANETLVTSGYDGGLLIYAADGTIRRRITGGSYDINGDGTADMVNPNFFAGLQVLPNGNYLVSNWSNHGKGNLLLNIPIVEYTPAGNVVWAWRDATYADRLSGLQAAIVVDGLDLTRMQVEGSDGKLKAVP